MTQGVNLSKEGNDKILTLTDRNCSVSGIAKLRWSRIVVKQFKTLKSMALVLQSVKPPKLTVTAQRHLLWETSKTNHAPKISN